MNDTMGVEVNLGQILPFAGDYDEASVDLIHFGQYWVR